MKMRYSIFAPLVFFISVLLSCNKDAECACTNTYDGANQNWTEEYDTTLVGVSKKDAEGQCNSFDESTTLLSETYSVDCNKK
jgi:hypothetical protein